MSYILMMFYIVNGDLRREERVFPDFQTCTQEKQLWLHEQKRLWVREAEAYCILKMEDKK